MWSVIRIRLLLVFMLWTALAAAQQTADGAFRAGQAAMARKDQATAQREFTTALALYAQMEAQASAQHRPLPSSTLANYGFALATVGRVAEATVKMKAACDSAPKNATLHDYLGSLYAQQQMWAEAEQQFAAAEQLTPQIATLHLRMGLVMQAQGKPAALDELARATALDPGNEPIALQYAVSLEAAGDDTRAIKVLQKLLIRHPSSVGAMYRLALAYQRSDRVPEAVTLFEKVLRAQPQNADALTNMGMALTQEQRAKDAVPILQKAVAMAPRNATALEDLSAAYVQLNQLDDAVTALKSALLLAPDSPQVHYDLGLAYKMQDDGARAIPELEQAERLDAKAPEPPLVLGMLYMQVGRYEKAAQELKTSLTMRPQNGDAWATLGSVYNKLDRLPEAEDALTKAIALLPEQSDPHLTLAAVYVKEKKSAQAVAERRQAAELMRGNMNRQRAEVATHVAESLLKSGDIAGAIVQFQDALTFDPSYNDAHAGLAKSYDAQGRVADAAAERAKIVKQP